MKCLDCQNKLPFLFAIKAALYLPYCPSCKAEKKIQGSLWWLIFAPGLSISVFPYFTENVKFSWYTEISIILALYFIIMIFFGKISSRNNFFKFYHQKNTADISAVFVHIAWILI